MKRYVKVKVERNSDQEVLQVVTVDNSQPKDFDYLIFVSK
jgi:hypothetical protein